MTERSPGRQSHDVSLRDVEEGDVGVFFEQQLDTVANRMAAFTAKDPGDRAAFEARWARIRTDDTIEKKTVLAGGEVAGHVMKYEESGRPEVTYWIGRRYWGRGIATDALSQFLDIVRVRPIFARAARDNVASLRVLEKCGFEVVAEDEGFANARGAETEEYVLELAGSEGDG